MPLNPWGRLQLVKLQVGYLAMRLTALGRAISI